MNKVFSLHNVIISVSLLVILLLVYLKTSKFELFEPTTPNPTLGLLNNDIINNSALVNFINGYIAKKKLQNTYSNILANRQVAINTYANQVTDLINPST